METLARIRFRNLAFAIICMACVVTQAHAGDDEKIARLERLIEAQQRQLEALQQQVMEMKQATINAQTEAKAARSLANNVAEDLHGRGYHDGMAKASDTHTPEKKVVTSAGGERVKLAISGHVNRMVSIIDDGKNTDTYHVDNDASESQVRFIGSAKVNDDLTLGGILELSLAPNKSGNLDQLNQEENNIFDQRRTEVILDSKRWGKISMGKGFTASYGTGAVDLSKTNVISYATIVDLAGSMIFREKDSGDLSDIRIFNAFNSFDGLSRQNRLRYDTPNFGGFRLATSAISDDRYDIALRWGGQGYGLKAAGAMAVSDPNLDNADLQYNGSFSLLHEETGLNATLSLGILERDNQDDAENYFGKIGVIKKWFSFGDTAFSIDYTRSVNLPTSNDDGDSYALAAVQQFDDYGSEVFALYRSHSLDRDSGPDVDDINIFSVGARVKF